MGGAAVDAGGGDGVVEDAEDRVGAGVRTGEGGEVVGEVGPVGSADRAGVVAMTEVGGNAEEVEGVGTLGCVDSFLSFTVTGIIVV